MFYATVDRGSFFPESLPRELIQILQTVLLLAVFQSKGPPNILRERAELRPVDVHPRHLIPVSKQLLRGRDFLSFSENLLS
jgi:hypothetical protein